MTRASNCYESEVAEWESG